MNKTRPFFSKAWRMLSVSIDSVNRPFGLCIQPDGFALAGNRRRPSAKVRRSWPACATWPSGFMNWNGMPSQSAQERFQNLWPAGSFAREEHDIQEGVAPIMGAVFDGRPMAADRGQNRAVIGLAHRQTAGIAANLARGGFARFAQNDRLALDRAIPKTIHQ